MGLNLSDPVSDVRICAIGYDIGFVGQQTINGPSYLLWTKPAIPPDR